MTEGADQELAEELAREVKAIREVMQKDFLENRIPKPDGIPLLQTMYDADTGILRIGLKHRLLLNVDIIYIERRQIFKLLGNVLVMESGQVPAGAAPVAGAQRRIDA